MKTKTWSEFGSKYYSKLKYKGSEQEKRMESSNFIPNNGNIGIATTSYKKYICYVFEF